MEEISGSNRNQVAAAFSVLHSLLKPNETTTPNPQHPSQSFECRPGPQRGPACQPPVPNFYRLVKYQTDLPGSSMGQPQISRLPDPLEGKSLGLDSLG